jgi:hypothetical protein
VRDNFTPATKMKLALRAGGVCSNPNCRRSTFGAKQGKDGYHNIGVAAHISEAPQPTKVLDVLVSQHTLIRSENGVLSFQHQQFQEWSASFEVETAMRSAASGNVAAACRLR